MLTQEVVFRVIWIATGEPVTDDDLEAIALKAPWARGLVYSDIEGFAAIRVQRISGVILRGFASGARLR